MATIQTWTQECLTILVQQQSPASPPITHIRYTLLAELLPMLTVAATFQGYTANDLNKKKKRRESTCRRWKNTRLKFIYLSAEDPVFETACKKDTKHDTGILDQVMV